MNVSAAADITAPARQCERPGPADGKTDFAQVKEAIEQESAVSTSGTRVFSGASDYILEWAQKYNVHISVTAVPDGENGTYMPALKNEPKLPLVHIHPKALERMENDIEFRNKVENSIRVHSQAMHYITERGGDAIAGTSITIHEDGSVTSAVGKQKEG